MTEDSASGNRWEPVPANRPTDPGPTEGAQPPTDATAQTASIAQPAEDTQVLASPAAPTGRSSLRRKGLLAGVAAALFLGGSAGGYALGHSTTSDPTAPTGSDPFGHHSGPSGFGPGDPDGDGHGPGRGYGETPGSGDDGGTGSGTDDGGSTANGTGA